MNAGVREQQVSLRLDALIEVRGTTRIMRKKWRRDIGRRLATELAWRYCGRPARHRSDGKIVVSLTSHPPRYSTLAATLKSLLRQTVAADETILWIAHEDCASLPQSVVLLQQEGLSIRTCADLRSYNKIIPALEAFPAATIVTADDDLYYPRTWLQTLVSSRMAGVREVLCHRARQVARLSPYKSWKTVHRSGGPTQLLFPLGVGGVLYPPGALNGRVNDITTFKRLCPTGDDIWLHWMRLLSGTPARCVGSGYDFAPWLGSQQVSLWSHNGAEGNDRQIANMIEAFGWPEVRSDPGVGMASAMALSAKLLA